MYHIDLKYIRMLSPKLEGFVQKKNELWNCRCPFCGDSAQKKNKKRGFFYKKGGNIFFRCFNCDYGTTLFNVIKHVDRILAKEYSLERFVDGGSKHGNYSKPNIIYTPPKFEKSQLDVDLDIGLPSIASLDDEHIAKKYTLDRKIPKGYFKSLYYAEDFKSFVDKLNPECSEALFSNDKRLVIPFKDENGEIKMFQGRALGANPLRYISIKLDENFPKIFGLNTVNKTEKVYIVEGPIDSLFLKNCIATADAALDFGAKYLKHSNVVLIPDAQPRNYNICRNIERFIEEGYKVCLLPETLPGKDINEFILNGVSKPELHRIIDNNTFCGLRAKIQYNNWKKC